MRPPRALPAAHFERNDVTIICETVHLDEEGFQYRPTQNEMKKLALEGISLLFIDCLKGK